MRYGLCAFLCLAAFSPSAVAQNIDKAKLRQAIEMPAVSSFLGVRFNSLERDSKGFKFDPRQKIKDLEKKLTGGPEDAQVFLDLRVVYLENMHDERTAKELVAKAEAVLRPHMQTTDPKLGYLYTVYATVLEVLAESPPWKDCEQWARRAVSVAPQDWRSWAYLAHTRHQQIPVILVGGDEKLLPKVRRTQEVIGALYTRRLRPEHVDQAEKALNDALQYHDKAKELAPNDPLRQEIRYNFRLTEIVLRNAICAFRGQKISHPLVQIDRGMLTELETTARLHPDHLLWQSQLVHHLTIAGWQQIEESKDLKTGKKKFRPARPEDAATIREALARIDKIAAAGNADTAVFCHTMAGTLCSSMQDYAAVEKHARQVLQIDPKSQIAWEQLEHALQSQERYPELLEAMQILARTLPSARNCCLLAKALAKNQRYDLAEQACVAGSKLDATDPYCNLTRAALLMRKGDDVESLKLAQTLLDLARRECRPEQPGLCAEVEYLAAIHQALSGDAVFAHLKLDRMKLDHPDVQRYETALKAMGW